MNESTLTKLALIWIFSATFTLFIIAEVSTAQPITDSIENHFGKEVVIQGEILKITPKESFTFIKLKTDTETIPVILFDNYQTNGTKLRIQGKVDIYRGEFEIIANRIWCEDCWSLFHKHF